MLLRLLLAASVTLVVAEAEAQRRGPKPKMARFAAQGAVQAVRPGAIQLLTNTNQTWIVFVDPKAKISVTGTAEPDFLKPGMFVQFSVELDKRGKARSPVGELTIFTPSEAAQIGIWPVDAVPEEGEDAQNGFGADAANPQPRSKRSKGTLAGQYAVNGRITGIRKGAYTVSFGRGTVQIKLTDEPQIKVDFADYSVAKKGDAITVTRGQRPPNMMGRAKATALEIVLSEPLTGPRKKKLARAKPAEEPKESEDEKKPMDEKPQAQKR